MKMQTLSKTDNFLQRLAIAIICIVLAVVPFHAFLTVWLSSLAGHYTLLRLWEEILLVPLAAIAVYFLVRQPALRRQLLKSTIWRLIFAYLMVQVICGIAAFGLHHVTAKALGYAWIVDTRFLIFFLAIWVIVAQTPQLSQRWRRLVFWPAALVVIFGLLQYTILPHDFLSHFGYSSATIFPYETINHNVHYIRIMSTLRGANPLGAYLVLIVSLLLATWQKNKRWRYIALSVCGVATLVLTFSRSAWIGVVLSLATVIYFVGRSARARRWLLWGGAGAAIILTASFLLLRHNVTFENTFFHTQEHSAVQSSSDQGHVTAFKESVHDLTHVPLGRGPGTAGPASIYNTGHPIRIAEDYWVQVSQEIGWLGLVLFAAINILVGRELWRRRDQPLALGLLAALIGVSFVNLLSHAWADETLSYLFWGLAAIALTLPNNGCVKSRENEP
jgi:O-antigen ligase